MGDSDNFDALKAADSLVGGTLMAVQVGGKKQKATIQQIDAVTSATNQVATIAALKPTLTTAWVDGANGTGAVTLTFLVDGAAPATPLSGTLFFAGEAVGTAAVDLATGATASTGQILELAAGTSVYHFVTSAAGVLVMTLTSTAGSYWVVFQQPDMTHLMSDELAITGP